MKKKVLFEMSSLYRDHMRVTGYEFGEGEKTACIVGSTRGNEVQQLFCASRMVNRLKELEQQGAIAPGKSIMVIPCVNPSSMNIEKRFWPTDNTDINRMFPGYSLGETTQRIAAGVFDQVCDYQYGFQFVSSYIPGKYVPHVRMMRTGRESADSAFKFGLPYVVIREPRPYDTTTLNYNWQIWDCQAYSLYTEATSHIHEESAEIVVDAILRFLLNTGVLIRSETCAVLDPETEQKMKEEPQDVVLESDEIVVKANAAGFLQVLADIKTEVKRGEVIARILAPFEGDVRHEICAPRDGTIFYACQKPLVNANNEIFKIIKR